MKNSDINYEETVKDGKMDLICLFSTNITRICAETFYTVAILVGLESKIVNIAFLVKF